jgi:hypothetical protein
MESPKLPTLCLGSSRDLLMGVARPALEDSPVAFTFLRVEKT